MTTPFAELAASGIAAHIQAPEPDRDSVDGRMPGAVVVPDDAAGVAAVLLWASERRLAVLVRGAGTKLGWGRPPDRLDIILDVTRLNRMLAHQQGDLTATVQAGATLMTINRALAAHRQWLPLDPPFARDATIGGLLATNDSGPLRHRYGTPRDLVIGVELATTDGLLAKAGGQVVKNVAGYDLSKVVSGSFGGLAAVVSATFKLSPLPQASSTIRFSHPDAWPVAEVIERIARTTLEPSAFELHATRGRSGGSTTCLLQFASVREAVDAQVAEACGIMGSMPSCDVVTDEEERALWGRHAARVWEGPGAVVRASWLPADVGAALGVLEKFASDGEVEIVGRIAVGAGLVRIAGTPEWQAGVIARLRDSTVVGNVVVVRGGPELKGRVDIWPPMPNAALLASVKRALDPNNVLGAGRGPF